MQKISEKSSIKPNKRTEKITGKLAFKIGDEVKCDGLQTKKHTNFITQKNVILTKVTIESDK